jgi:choline dehydrogenase-like flavoprotein
VPSSTLSVAQRRVLDTLVARLAPPPVRPTLGDEVAARIGRLSPRQQRDLGIGLLLLGAPATIALSGQGWRRLASLSAPTLDALIAQWLGSSFAPVRQTITALKRLTLATYIAAPDTQQALGLPPHSRTQLPRFSWDGAAAGEQHDHEPIARGSARPTPNTLPSAQVLDPRQLIGSTRSADVIIIGSGAGGSLAAARLTAAGHSVIVVERGDLLPLSARTEDDATLIERCYADGGTRTTDDLTMPILQGSAVGGGTLINWMITLRTPPHVLDEWGRAFGIDDVDAGTLTPTFERLERELRAREVPEDAHSANNRRLLDGARALGWRHASARINADRCLRAGTCGLGCTYGAKQDATQVHLYQALSGGALLIPRARADRLRFVERGGARPLKAVTVTLHDAANQPVGTAELRAPLVLCAGGAIETPALLQRSGLGGDRVGDYLRLHPTTPVLGRYSESIQASTGIPLSVIIDEFAAVDPDGYGYWLECPPLQPTLAAVSIPTFGADAGEWLSHLPYYGAFIALTRDGAERAHSSGRVRARRDGSVSISYRLAPRDEAHVRAATLAAVRLHWAAGAVEVRTLHRHPTILRTPQESERLATRSFAQSEFQLSSAHVNGTCRMTDDRRTGGCDPTGQRWGAPGVYVVDGSLLPTAPGVNPQLTVMAMADRVCAALTAGT